jgi:hypothetical protein
MKRAAAVILVGMLLVCIVSFPERVDGATVSVVVELDIHEVTVGAEHNLSRLPVIWGNVTCSIEGLNADYQTVEVDLRCSGGWPVYGDLFPNDMTFTEPGVKPFNVTIYVSETAPNQTTAYLYINGLWQTEGSIAGQVRQSGNTTAEKLTININRTFGYYENQPIIVPEDLTQQINEDEYPWQLWLIIAIPIVLVALIIAFIIVFKFRRKKAKQGKGKKDKRKR